MNSAMQVEHSADRPLRPPVLDGFSDIKHYWDRKHHIHAVRILPGEYYVSRGDELIATVLGSCVSACIRDIDIGIGGMNHFMLPEGRACTDGAACLSNSTRYGGYAMEHLINTILANGGRRERLEIKLFGGGRVLQIMTDVGSRNIHFVRDYLRMETLPVTTEDLGGTHPRKVLYFPASGRVLLRKLPIIRDDKVTRRELEYQRSLDKTTVAGEIDLF